MRGSTATGSTKTPPTASKNEPLHRHVQDRLSCRVSKMEGRTLGSEGPTWQGKEKPHRGDRRWVQGCSPKQISKRLTTDFPENRSMRTSHEAIYQSLYVESRGALKRELAACLRSGRSLRIPRKRVGSLRRTVTISATIRCCDDRLNPARTRPATITRCSPLGASCAA